MTRSEFDANRNLQASPTRREMQAAARKSESSCELIYAIAGTALTIALGLVAWCFLHQL